MNANEIMSNVCHQSKKMLTVIPIEGMLGQQKRRKTILCSGLNFINVLHTAFTLADPKSVKKIDKLSIFFTLLGSTSVKAVRRTLMKSTQGRYHEPVYVHVN